MEIRGFAVGPTGSCPRGSARKNCRALICSESGTLMCTDIIPNICRNYSGTDACSTVVVKFRTMELSGREYCSSSSFLYRGKKLGCFLTLEFSVEVNRVFGLRNRISDQLTKICFPRLKNFGHLIRRSSMFNLNRWPQFVIEHFFHIPLHQGAESSPYKTHIYR